MDASRASCIRTERGPRRARLSNQLAQCNAMSFTETEAAAIRSGNSRFPFNFTRSPRSFSATLSLPLFDGLPASQRLQESDGEPLRRAVRLRGAELALTAGRDGGIPDSYDGGEDGVLQEQNAAKAKQELKCSGSLQDRGDHVRRLTEARATYERAESEESPLFMTTTKPSPLSRAPSVIPFVNRIDT